MRKINFFIILIITSVLFSGNLFCQDKWSVEDLLISISNEDITLVTKLYESDPGYFRVCARGCLPAAVEIGTVSIARYLIDKGADVNYVNSNDETPLNIAAEWADYEMIELLCQKGANDKPDGQLWGKSKTTLISIQLVFEKRNMSAGTKERHGVRRTIRYGDIKKSLEIINKYLY